MTKLESGMKAVDFTYRTPWSDNHRFFDQLNGKKTILMFFRYFGCRVCQIDISRLIAGYDKILEKNGQIFAVLQTEPEIISEQDKEEDIPFTFICDPEHELYKLYDVGAAEGGLTPEGRAAVDVKLNEAIAKGLVKYENNGKEIAAQLPACFIIEPDGVISYSHYGTHYGDVPTVDQLVKLLENK